MSGRGDKFSKAIGSTLNDMRRTLKGSFKNGKHVISIEESKTQAVCKRSTIAAAKAGKTRVIISPSTEKTAHSQDRKTPFLTIPQELRDQIYELVFGSHIIDTTVGREISNPKRRRKEPLYHEDERWHQRIRFLDTTPSSTYMQSTSGQDESLTRVVTACRDTASTESASGSEDKLDLRLLRVCKQIRGEAKPTLYKANAFLISEGFTFQEFSRQLPDQFRSLRALHLDVNLTSYESAIEWTRAFNDRPLGSANTSKSLHLHTLHLRFTLRYNQKQKNRSPNGLGPDFWVSGFLRLQGRQLEQVTVEMDFYEAWKPELVDNDFVDAEKRRSCERLRGRLLEAPRSDPTGTIDLAGLQKCIETR